MSNIESSGRNWSKKLAWMLNVFLLLLSGYIVWGWITTGDIKRFFEGSLIEPFMAFSDNFLSAIYSFGLGFTIGFVILLSKCLKNYAVPTRVIALRPFLGGCCAACIFLLVLSFGSLLLEGAGEVKPSSLGIIGAMGAILCERFERILKEAVPQKLESLS